MFESQICLPIFKIKPKNRQMKYPKVNPYWTTRQTSDSIKSASGIGQLPKGKPRSAVSQSNVIVLSSESPMPNALLSNHVFLRHVNVEYWFDYNMGWRRRGKVAIVDTIFPAMFAFSNLSFVLPYTHPLLPPPLHHKAIRTILLVRLKHICNFTPRTGYVNTSYWWWLS